ncbi:MAG: AbrB/MazE/SpoVT family DNA-binding domain-containing protein [Clostridia bacterium]|nr:AbrB/MazE/SpoVT family DNA-binding domain-containing protein [Clostridia bacterium]
MNFKVKKTLDRLARIVIPKNMRDYYGIDLGDELLLIATKDGILVTKLKEDGAESSR